MTHIFSVSATEPWQEGRVLHILNDDVAITLESGAKAEIAIAVAGTVSMDVRLAEGANLTLLCLQTDSADVSQCSTLRSGAAIRWFNVSLAPVKATLESKMVGPSARSDIDWIFYAKHAEELFIRAQNTFESSDGRGCIALRGIAEDTSKVRCDGMLAIGPQGRGTETFLTEEVLMLDPSATVNAVPGLEIKTNDVKASHSATVSRLTESDLFYFGSRGIEEITARRMFIEGFLSQSTDTLSSAMADRIREAVDRKCDE